jgi:hypothetical protein
MGEGEREAWMRGTEAVGSNPVLDFGVDRNALAYVGHDLQRPE